MNKKELRGALTAIQSAFTDKTLQIEVDHNDVRVYIKNGMGRTRVDTRRGFEENLLEAAEKARELRR